MGEHAEPGNLPREDSAVTRLRARWCRLPWWVRWPAMAVGAVLAAYAAFVLLAVVVVATAGHP